MFSSGRAAALVIGLFTVYLATTCPTVHWLDGGELTAAAFHLSAAHPPGEPVFILAGKLASLLPVGDVAFRLNALSAVCAALAGAIAYRITRRLSESGAAASDSPGTPLRLITIIAPLLSYPIWIQGVRAEVYALELLLALTAVDTALRAGILEDRIDVRYGMVCAFLTGLNLAVHPLLGLLAALPVLIVAICRRGFPPRLWAGMVMAGGLGVSSCLLIPLRSRAHPGHGWGAPDHLESLLDVLLARTFQHNFSPLTAILLRHNLEVTFGAIVTATGPVVPALSVGGLVVLIWRRQLRVGLLLAGLLAFNLWSILPQNKVFAQNPDFHGYLAVSHLTLWMLVAVALTSLCRALRHRFRLIDPLATLLVLSLAAPGVALSVGRSDRSGDDLARRFAMAALKELPAGGYLQVSGNNTGFVLNYLQEVERLRPDVQVLSRPLLTHPWYRARLPYDEKWARAAAGSVGELLPLVTPRALRVELRQVDLPAARDLCPAPAPGWGFYDVGDCPTLAAAHRRPDAAGLSALPEAFTDPDALIVGINARAFLADYYAARGQPAWAAEERAALEALSPGLVISETGPSSP